MRENWEEHSFRLNVIYNDATLTTLKRVGYNGAVCEAASRNL